MTIHLLPTAELAPRVLLPGDPGRALFLAQELLDKPARMFNHNRGLWGYTGTSRADGEPLSIQSTGMGGPSAAIVTEELVALGAERLVRVGTCGALDPALGLGDLLVAERAVARDGASVALGAEGAVAADAVLTERLARAGRPAAERGAVASVDLFYARAGVEHDDEAASASMRAVGTRAVEMEAATIFTVAELRGVRAACILVVSDTFSGGGSRRRIDPEQLEHAALRAGGVAVAALGPDGL